MNKELFTLVERLNHPALSEVSIIKWGSPIFSFGNLLSSKVATLGINPSNREFVDTKGRELDGENRRFHTLNSLGIADWAEVEKKHLNSIVESCHSYFHKNPYDTWFRRLDYIISGTTASYYSRTSKACHLDLIPYATLCKWTELSPQQRLFLIEISEDALGLLLRNSSVELLILNGQSVVNNLEHIAEVTLTKKSMSLWSLPRKTTKDVMGYSYTGTIKSIRGVKLKKKIKVLGYNHNIQSSFGVTKAVQSSIRHWIAKRSKENFS